MSSWPRCPDRSPGRGFQCVLREGHDGHHFVGDPKDSPLVRHELYTNEVVAILSSLVGALLWRAEPDHVKRALETMLENWDERVAVARSLADMQEQRSGEPSGWPSRPPGS